MPAAARLLDSLRLVGRARDCGFPPLHVPEGPGIQSMTGIALHNLLPACQRSIANASIYDKFFCPTSTKCNASIEGVYFVREHSLRCLSASISGSRTCPPCIHAHAVMHAKQLMNSPKC